MIGLPAARGGPSHVVPIGLAVVAVAINDSVAGPRCKDDLRGLDRPPAHVRRHVNLVMCCQGRFNGGGARNPRLMHAILEYESLAIWGVFHISAPRLAICPTLVTVGGLSGSARIFGLTRSGACRK